jgi:RNA-directed DNA polymerase
MNLSETPIIQNSLLKLDRNPYLTVNHEYYMKRKEGLITAKFKAALYKMQRKICPVCEESLFNGEKIEIHHINPQRTGGKYKIDNCQALHEVCHKKVTHDT